MMFGIQRPAVYHRPLVPNPSHSSPSPTKPRLASSVNLRQTDVLSLSEDESSPFNKGSNQRTALQVRSQSHTGIAADGSTWTMSTTKLRFHYTFEAADGTKIQIRAQANLHYAAASSDDEQTQSLKLRAAIRVSVLQEDVTSGLSPLVDGSETSEDIQSAVSQALDLFNEAAKTLTSAFMESDTLDGDRLIVGLVDAFNGLSESVNSLFLPSLPAPETVAASDVGELLAEPAPVKSGEVVATEPEQLEATAPAEVEAPLEETGSSGEAESPLVENLDLLDASAVAMASTPESEVVEEETASKSSVAEAETVEPPPVESAPVASAPAASVQMVGSSLLLKLRFQMIQSLKSLVSEFRTETSSLRGPQSSLRVSARFSANYAISMSGTPSATFAETSINTHV